MDVVPRARPTLVQAISNHRVTAIAPGPRHTLFLTERGSVYAAGANDECQLGFGQGLLPAYSRPTLVTARQLDGRVRAVAAGAAHSAALDAAGALWLWGRGQERQLGTGSHARVAVPQRFDWRVRGEMAMAVDGAEVAAAPAPAVVQVGGLAVRQLLAAGHCSVLVTEAAVAVVAAAAQAA
jgi:alpha-tubulin suppressor-like RCC1 family protein